MTKVTISTKFGEVIKALKGEDTTLSTDELITFIEERQAQAQKKAGSKKETERQKENEVLKGVILDVLNGSDEGKTVTEIMNTPKVSGFATAEPLSNQRVTAVLRLMITNDGTVGKNKVGKSMKYFAIG
jgi:hypothetical protein